MSSSTLTPQIAPRDPAQLALVSPFQLRTLADKVGAFTTPAQQMAWHSMNAQQRATEISRLLLAWDAANPGQYQGGGDSAPAQQVQQQAAPPQQMQMAPPPQQQMQVAPPQQQQIAQPMSPPAGIPGAVAVPGMTMGGGAPNGMPMGIPGMTNGGMPGSFPIPGGVPGAPPMVPPGVVSAAQQAAAAPPATGGKRAPKTSANGAAAPGSVVDLGADVLGLLTGIAASVVANQKVLEGFSKTLTDATSSKESRLTTVEANLKTLGETLQGMAQTNNNLQQMLVWVVLMNVSLIGEKQGMSPVEALSMVMSDSQMFNQMVQQASTGK